MLKEWLFRDNQSFMKKIGLLNKSGSVQGLNELKRRKARYGLLSICAAGGMAAAMILERP